MHARQQSQVVADAVEDAHAGKPDLGLVVPAVPEDVAVPGLLAPVAPAGAFLIDILVTYSRAEHPVTPFDLVVDVNGDRLGFLQPVAGIAEQSRVVQDQPAVFLVIAAVALQPVLFVLMVTDTDFQVMTGRAKIAGPVEIYLYSAGEILTGVGPQLDAAGRGIDRSIQDALEFGRAESPQ